MTQNPTSPTESKIASAAVVNEPPPKIEAVVIDIDGTLLNSASELTKRVETAIKNAIAQGVKIILATGKTRVSVDSFVGRLGIDSPGIFVQGCVTCNADGSIRTQTTLNDAIARQFITYAEDRGFAVALYSGSRILVRAHSKYVEDHITHYHEVQPEAVGPLQNQLGSTPVNKLIAFGEPRAITGLRWQLNLQIGSLARILQAGVPEMLEVLPLGASKGAALKHLASELRISSERILAIGDAENDIEMIQFAGIGIAMGNADERTKAAADHVVAGNNQDGVAEALEKFVIVKPAEPEKPAAPAEKPAAAAAKPPVDGEKPVTKAEKPAEPAPKTPDAAPKPAAAKQPKAEKKAEDKSS